MHVARISTTFKRILLGDEKRKILLYMSHLIKIFTSLLSTIVSATNVPFHQLFLYYNNSAKAPSPDDWDLPMSNIFGIIRGRDLVPLAFLGCCGHFKFLRS
jgi:hypothetical protein